MSSGLIHIRRVAAHAALLLLAAQAACSRRGPNVGVADPARGTRPPSPGGLASTTQLYQEMGLIAASGGGLPFVGSVGFLAGRSPDTTLTVIALSFPNRVLTFARENDRYKATYDVRVDLKQGGNTVRHVEAQEVVRVATFKETARNDESVIFQQILSVPPGQYTLALAVRDAGSVRLSTYEAPLRVPRLGPGAVGTPVAVYEATPRGRADSLPSLVASPRATAVFGRDTALSVYAEGYGGAGEALRLTASIRGEKGAMLWHDTVSLPRRAGAPGAPVPLYSGTFRVPVSRMGVGPSTLVVRRADGGVGSGAAGVLAAPGADSGRVAMFVSFGDDLPVASFEEMLSYLRYFAPAHRLKSLRDTTPEARSGAWAAFLRETDPVPGTALHEGLRDYFGRIQAANLRYREEGGPGWLTDRGMVYVTLGDPDQLYDQGPGEIAQRGRIQVWDYHRHQTRLVFVDMTGFGRWRLNTPSESEFHNLVRRLQR
jgi:GWxTD domain-containing protein